MNKFDLEQIHLPEGIDKAIGNGVQRAIREKRNRMSKGKKLWIGAAASIGLFFTIGIINPSIASSVPFIENTFERIQNELTFSGDYSNYATSVNQTVYDNGVGVTLSEVYCDGQSLYVSYKVESDEPFIYTKYDYDPVQDYDLTPEQAEKIVGSQLMYIGNGKVDFTKEYLDDAGIAGIEGRYLDEHTFVGVEKYDLTTLNKDIPDQFQYNITLRHLTASGWHENDKDQVLKGKWSFSIPVTVDTASFNMIPVNKVNEDGIGVENVTLTPFEIKIRTNHPETSKVWAYYINVYDDKGNLLDWDNQKWEDTYSIATLPKRNLDTTFIEIVLYQEILEPVDETTSTVVGDKKLYRVKVDLAQ